METNHNNNNNNNNIIRTFTNVPIKDIQTYLASNTQPFESSQLYSSIRDEKFVDEDLRKSTFRTIHDPKLFDLIESTILQPLINDDPRNQTHHFMLRRNDVTHIQYRKGGFFKKHRDYLSTTSNFVEEFTFLLCVTPTSLLDEEDLGEEAASVKRGGETKLFGYGTSKEYDTSTPGAGLLFRKDLEHEGCELLKGEKHIITLNLWATRKETSDQVLLVTFPNEYDTTTTSMMKEDAVTDQEDANEDDNQKKKNQRLLLDIASNEFMSYAIPVQNLFGMLEAYVRFANVQHFERLGLTEEECEEESNNNTTTTSKPPLVLYECKDFDFETFGVLVKIFNSVYVEEEELAKAMDCLDYFGPFSTECILVNLSLNPIERKVGSSTDGGEGNDDGPYVKELTTKLKYKALLNDNKIDPDIIICENEARMKAVAKVAQMMGEPFVPFKIAFVEGALNDDMESIVSVPMSAAACLVGDYNNIFSIWELGQRFRSDNACPLPLNKVHLENNFWSNLNDELMEKYNALTPGTNKLDGFDIRSYGYSEFREMARKGYGFGLKLGFPRNVDVKAEVAKTIFDGNTYEIANFRQEATVFLPGLDNSQHDEKENTSSFFHYNNEGYIAFTNEEAERTSNYISSIDFEAKVKRQLQLKQFELPQEIGKVDAMFCNEAVYGKVNILWVCGVMRLESSATKQGDSDVSSIQHESFDAWPSRNAKDRIERYKRKWTEVMQTDGAEWEELYDDDD